MYFLVGFIELVLLAALLLYAVSETPIVLWVCAFVVVLLFCFIFSQHHWHSAQTGWWWPLFSWWMFVLLILAVIARILGWRVVAAIVGCVALILAVLSSGTSRAYHAVRVAPTIAMIRAQQSCPEVKSKLATDLKVLSNDDHENPYTHNQTLDEMNGQDAVNADRFNLLGRCSYLLPAAPVARYVVASVHGLTVTFDASASSGTELQYSWLTKDPNHPDGVSSGIMFTWNYTEAGTYTPPLKVTDIYGRFSVVAHSVTVP